MARRTGRSSDCRSAHAQSPTSAARHLRSDGRGSPCALAGEGTIRTRAKVSTDRAQHQPAGFLRPSRNGKSRAPAARDRGQSLLDDGRATEWCPCRKIEPCPDAPCSILARSSVTSSCPRRSDREAQTPPPCQPPSPPHPPQPTHP